MSSTSERIVTGPAELLHGASLALAAVALLAGLLARETAWVRAGISLVILLPPLRLATTIIGEARARRYRVAAMGVVVLAFLILSRRIS